MARLTEKQVIELFMQDFESIRNDLKSSDKKREGIVLNIEESLETGRYNIVRDLELKSRELKQLDFKVDASKFDTSLGKCDKLLDKYDKLLDKQKAMYEKEEEREKKKSRKNQLNIIASLGTMLLLAFSFFMVTKSYEDKVKIEEDYANELREKGQYLSAKDAEFIQKIYKWKAKNPKDSKAWIDAVNKTK